MERKIPKVIHYCWLSNDPVPEQLQQYMESWHGLMPDYEFIKWDFTRFDKASSAWVSEAFDNKKYAFAADYIRMYALYTMGGIYMDMDVEVLKPFDNLLNNDLMFAYEDEAGKYLEAGCFGATKGNAFIKKCLEYYTNRHFIKEDGSLDILTLPRIITPIYNNDVKSIPFSFDYFTAKSSSTEQIKITENTYSIHHFDASWVDKGVALIKKNRLDNWGFELTSSEKIIYSNILQYKISITTKEELLTATSLMDRLFRIGEQHYEHNNLQILIKSFLKQIAESGIQNKVTSLKLYFTTFRKWKIFETPRAKLRYIYHCLRNILHG